MEIKTCSSCKGSRSARQRARSAKITNNLPSDAYYFIIQMYGKCLKCESIENLEVDHVVPLALGGPHELINLQVLCKSCNCKKGARSMDDYRDFVVFATPAMIGVS